MIRLYRAPFSTNVERVALALAHKGLDVESVVIDYGHREPVIEASGQPLVPVIEDGGEVIADSRRILRHLDRAHPEPPLFPPDPARRAEVDLLTDWFDEVWKVAPNAIEAELTAPTPDEERIVALGALMARRLDRFEALLHGRDFLMGDALGAADCVAFPFLKYAAGREPGDDELFHRVLDDNQALAPGHERLAAWIERVSALPRA